jgi:hypothetical protein
MRTEEDTFFEEERLKRVMAPYGDKGSSDEN